MGEYFHTADAKGRVILPTDLRDELGGSLVVTKGLDACLFLYTDAEWKVLADKLQKLPMAKPEARAIVRFFFSGARQVSCDKQGRFLIPPNLREFAGLDKEVVWLGMSSRLELWSRSRWQQYNDKIEPAAAELAGMLADLGI